MIEFFKRKMACFMRVKRQRRDREQGVSESIDFLDSHPKSPYQSWLDQTEAKSYELNSGLPY